MNRLEEKAKSESIKARYGQTLFRVRMCQFGSHDY